MCLRHISAGATFIGISLLPGCRHGAQDEEALSEQGDAVIESQVKTPKPGPSIQKSHSFFFLIN